MPLYRVHVPFGKSIGSINAFQDIQPCLRHHSNYQLPPGCTRAWTHKSKLKGVFKLHMSVIVKLLERLGMRRPMSLPVANRDDRSLSMSVESPDVRQLIGIIVSDNLKTPTRGPLHSSAYMISSSQDV